MKTRNLLSVILLFVAAESYGHESISDSLVTVKGITYVPPMRYSGLNPIYTTVDQHEIPRHANGGNPAGQLVGYGPASVIRGNANTIALQASPVDLRAVVITQDYGDPAGVGFYQRTVAGPKAAILRPVIRDLTIMGHDETPYDYGDRGIIDSDPGINTVAGGAITFVSDTTPVRITTNVAAPYTGQKVDIAGNMHQDLIGTWTVAWVSPTQFDLVGSTRKGQALMGTWTRKDFHHGALIKGTGPTVENTTFYYIPGTPLVMLSGIGAKGGQRGQWDSEKARLWNCKFVRCYRGPEIGLVDAIVGDLEIWGVADYGIKFTAGSAQLRGYFHIYGVGGPCMWFPSGSGNSWGSGPFYLENASRGLLIENKGTVLSNIHSHTCSVANIELTWQSEYTTLSHLDLLVQANSKGVIANGWHNKLLGGKITLQSSSSIGVQVPATGSEIRNLMIKDIVFVGPPGGGQGTAIDVDHTLVDAHIDVHFKSLAMGLDLRENDGTSRLGSGCTINLTSDGDLNDVATVIELPSSWDKSNKIIVDGMIVKGSITNVSDAAQAVISSAAHGLKVDDQIAIRGVQGETAVNNASGQTHTITSVTTDTFTISVNTSGAPSYTAGTGWWGVWQPK